MRAIMACDSVVCLFLIIMYKITCVFCNDDCLLPCYYYTDVTRHGVGYYIDLKLLENEAHYHKRDVQEAVQRSVLLVGTNATENTTDEVSIPPPKKKSVKLQKTPFVPNTTLSTKDLIAKHLGVNITQHRNLTSEVSTQSPLLYNNTSRIGWYPPLPSDADTDSGQQKFNQSLADLNITTLKTDSHQYYNSSYYTDPEVGHYYWVDLDDNKDVKVNDLLSNSHRRAATIKLSFEFPFYGHSITNVTIATGGFIYTGDYIHSWLAATQYIAPLMANFDNSVSNDSCIKYVDNGTALTVEWERVSLQEKPNDGDFTFQVTLHKSGDVVFVYKSVPLLVEDIQDINHPVKVGLSDAYIMDRTIFYVRRKTIYEYHRVHFPKEDIKNWTVIYLKALPTCLDSHDCDTCLAKVISFQCTWCPGINRCSTGMDRHRQDWVTQDCSSKRLDKVSMCAYLNSSDNVYFQKDYRFEHLESSKTSQVYTPKNQQDNVGVSGIVAILFLVAMVSGLAVWIFYAYRNPHTLSGQILIRYRPSQWKWRRGEARYTAATIHM